MNSAPISLSHAAVLDAHEGSSPFELFLIVSQPGHPPDAEKVLLEVLKEIHGQRPLELLFTASDPQHVYRRFDDKELPLDPYRAYPCPDATSSVIATMLNSFLISAEFAFGVVSQPAVRVCPVDDWFGWALSRDSIRTLAARSAALAITLSLVALPQELGRADKFERVARYYGWVELFRVQRTDRGGDPFRPSCATTPASRRSRRPPGSSPRRLPWRSTSTGACASASKPWSTGLWSGC